MDTQDVFLTPVAAPPAVVVTVKPYIGTVVKPPAARRTRAVPVHAAMQVVVLVRSAELHPVAVLFRRARLGQHVSGVSAESRQAQSILVSIHLGPDLQNILRQSYDNAKVTIDVRRTSNLHEHPTKGARFFLGTIHLQSCKIVLWTAFAN